MGGKYQINTTLFQNSSTFLSVGTTTAVMIDSSDLNLGIEFSVNASSCEVAQNVHKKSKISVILSLVYGVALL